MTQGIERLNTSRSLLDIVERASLFALLQQALARQKQPQELPSRLYADLGMPPSQWPDFSPRGR